MARCWWFGGNMTNEEIRKNLLDTYNVLLRIKAEEKGVNKELERQILLIKIKLSSFLPTECHESRNPLFLTENLLTKDE